MQLSTMAQYAKSKKWNKKCKKGDMKYPAIHFLFFTFRERFRVFRDKSTASHRWTVCEFSRNHKWPLWAFMKTQRVNWASSVYRILVFKFWCDIYHSQNCSHCSKSSCCTFLKWQGWSASLVSICQTDIYGKPVCSVISRIPILEFTDTILRIRSSYRTLSASAILLIPCSEVIVKTEPVLATRAYILEKTSLSGSLQFGTFLKHPWCAAYVELLGFP